jgi:hypothetical protein
LFISEQHTWVGSDTSDPLADARKPHHIEGVGGICNPPR